jgi:hypothetical protein
MKRLLAVGTASALLAACVNFEEEAQERCAKYGFEPGTTVYAQCLQTEVNFQKQALSEALASLSDSLQDTGRSFKTSPSPMIIPPREPLFRNTRCSQTPMTRSVSCTTW